MKKISTLFPLQTVKDQAIGNSMKQSKEKRKRKKRKKKQEKKARKKSSKQNNNKTALLEIYSGVNLAGSTFRVLHRSGLKRPV